MLSLAALALAASAPSPAERRCDRAIAAAVRANRPAVVPPGCWRVGPIALGMDEAEVERRLGAPAARREDATGMTTLHVFPLRAGRLVADGRARFRMAELRYAAGRLVALDANPGARITAAPCKGDPGRVPSNTVDTSVPTGPLLRFAGVEVGDATSLLARRFGRAPASNRPHDWLNYLPVPVSFDVDPDRGRVDGFAIARDEDALTADRPLPAITLRRDPATCRLVGVDFALGG